MGDIEHSFLVYSHSFTTTFKIQQFKESPIDSLRYDLSPNEYHQVCLGIKGDGNGSRNKGYVTFFLNEKIYREKINKCQRVVCTFIANVLDAEGEKRFPCTIHMATIHPLRHRRENEARYIERSTILNSVSEYLVKDTLTVIVEGNFSVYVVYTNNKLWKYEIIYRSFQVKQLDRGLEVSLYKRSAHACFLSAYSKVFRSMWGAPMRENSEECYLIRTEEIPAFLCMLAYIVTDVLVMYQLSVFDLYKIAHIYDIKNLLIKCRERIKKDPHLDPRPILKFAAFYNDEELTEFAESEIRKRSLCDEPHTELSDACDIGPVRCNVIKSEDDFKKCLQNICDLLEEGYYTCPQVNLIIPKLEFFDFYY